MIEHDTNHLYITIVELQMKQKVNIRRSHYHIKSEWKGFPLPLDVMVNDPTKYLASSQIEAWQVAINHCN